MKSREDLQLWIESMVAEAAEPIPCINYAAWLEAETLRYDMGRLARYAVSMAESYEVSRDSIRDRCRDINYGKGRGYAPDDDILKNFYGIAAKVGIAPASVWAVYVMKHVDWINTFAATGVVHGSEGFADRIVDVVMYAALGQAIVLREKGVSDGE